MFQTGLIGLGVRSRGFQNRALAPFVSRSSHGRYILQNGEFRCGREDKRSWRSYETRILRVYGSRRIEGVPAHLFEGVWSGGRRVEGRDGGGAGQ